MPSTLPAGILALQGVSSSTQVIVLMEWLLPTPQYYSSRETVTWNSHTWEGYRIKSFPSFTLGIFDRKGREFPKLDITLSNLANDGSSLFPMQQLDASHELENYPIKIYFYSPEAGTAFLRWAGYSGRPSYHGADKSVSLSATFIFDSLNIPFPFRTLGDLGFAQLDTNQNKANNQEPMIPMIWGDGPDLAVRVTIDRAWSEGGLLNVNFILTGCNDGHPMDADIITQAKLNGTTLAATIEFGGLGTAGQTAPANLSRFPDGEAHPRVAYGFMSFPLPDDLKDSLDSLEPDAIKVWLANGRPLAATGAPSENHVLIIVDLVTDAYFSLGLAAGDFDADVNLDTENYVGTRYRARLELHESMPLMDLLGKLLGDCHCYITFADKIQIRAKRNDETACATFATSDSGQSGRKIVNDFIELVDEEDSSTLLNDVMFSYRRKNRHFGAPIHAYDPNAQSFTPGNINKPAREEIESLSLQYEDEAKISAAILVREEISGNMFPTFKVPFWDGLAADDGTPLVAGRVIAVYGPDAFNNTSNYLFRILTQSFDPIASQITFKCKVYKPAIYNDDSDGIGIDLLRGGQDTSQQGRPPDVTPVSLAIIDVDTNDTGGTQLAVQATCTIPAHDPTDENDKGIHREPPIAAVGCWYHRTDEPVSQARHGATIEVQQSTSAFNVSLQFDVDYHKNRTLEVFFVALPPSRSKSPLGYIRDTTKVNHLTAQLSATAISATVASEAVFSVDDYVIIEKEFCKVLSKAPLTFVNDGAGHRTAQLGSYSVIHPNGIEVAVAKKSYPSLTLLLAIRKTFLNVTGFAADQEDDGVRLHWDPLQVDNLDYYLAYYSLDADALTNPAKLGSTSPTWFTADPETPPAGVTVQRTKHKHYKIPATGVAANVTVAGRAAAKNHKGNYSSLLSNSASNKSTGHGVVPLFVPSDPAIGDIISLGVPSEINHKQIPVRLRIWANGADHSKKFDDAGADRIGFFYAPPQAGNPALPDLNLIDKRHQNLTDTSQASSEIVEWFPVGQKLFWLGNFTSNGSGKSLSANQTANIAFIPGDYSLDPADLVTYSIVATPINDKFTRLDAHIVQPSVGKPVLLKNQWWDRQLPAESYVELSDKLIPLHGDTSFSQLGADFHLYAEVKHPPGLTGINYRGRIVAHGGLSRSVSTSANSAADPDVPADTAVPGTPGAPTFVKVKKNGTHVRMPLPATSRASHSHNLLVIASASAPANGVTVLTASDLTTGTVLSSSNDAAGQIEAGRKKTTVEIDRTGLEAVFGAGATIYFWIYAVNDIGTSLRGASVSYSLATGELGALVADTAVPSTPGAPTFIKVKKNGTHVRMPLPASQRLSHSHNLLVIASASAPSNGVQVLTASDLTTGTILSSSNDAAGQIESGRKKTTVEIDRAGLETVFGAGATIYFWFYSVNDVGTSLRSGSTSYSLATGEMGSVGDDVDVPATLGTPNLGFIAKVGLTYDNLTVGLYAHTLKQLYIVVYNGSSTYFDLPTYFSSGGVTVQAAASEAAARYKVKLKGQGHLGVRLANLKTILGTTAKLYFYAENDRGTSTKSTDSAGLTLANAKDLANSGDVVVRVSSGIYPPGKQLLSNAAMILDDGSGNLGVASANLRWKRWDKATTPIRTGGGTSNVGTTNTDPIYWSKANRCVIFNNTTQMLVQNVQARLMPGESYSVPTVKVKSSGTPTGLELRFYFKRNDTAVDNLDNLDNGALAYGKLNLTGLGTSYQEFGIPMKFKDSPSIDDGSGNYVNQMLCIELVGTLGGATVSLTDIMFCRGLIPVTFDVLESEIGQIANALLPALVPSSAELTNPVGLDGGWQNLAGLGGVVSRLAQ